MASRNDIDTKPVGNDLDLLKHTENLSDEKKDCNTKTEGGIAILDDREEIGHISMRGPQGDSVPIGNSHHEELEYLDDDDDEYTTDTEASETYEDIPLPPVRRQSNPELPDTVTVLNTPQGGKVYLVGTAHYSKQSWDDVAKTIQATQPDVIMVELCKTRANILDLNEESLIEEAKNMNIRKMMEAIKKEGVIQGVLHYLLVGVAAELTKDLGMAPGGEFRTAFRESEKIPGCLFVLGDRPVHITLRRAFSALSWWQKIQVAYHMLTAKNTYSKEDIEKMKQRDLLEELMREMAGDFPALSRVLVHERDLYLAYFLRQYARLVNKHRPDSEPVPTVVVGVVGIGHSQGIVQNWDSVSEECVKSIMQIPKGSWFGTAFRWSFRATLVALVSWGCYKIYRWTVPLLGVIYSSFTR